MRSAIIFAALACLPNTHYGMFIEGFTSNNDRIYAMRGTGDVQIQSDGAAGYTALPWETFRKGVPLIIGVYVHNPKLKDQFKLEWLSCTIKPS